MGADQTTPAAPPDEPRQADDPPSEAARGSNRALSRAAVWNRQLSARARVALWAAVGADVAQILLVPAFVEGWFSPANDILDVLVACLMFGLLGWHPALLPSFIAELVPVLGLFPTWTIAVLFVTRKRA